MAKNSSSKATQEFVPIEEVRDGIVVLRDGGLRAVLMASSINFALKSAEEQEATLAQFQNFLNSLDFSVQFFIQSRDLDIRPYMHVLEERVEAQTDDLMRVQIREYMEFIKKFVEGTNIMSKSFFIVVPYNPATISVSESPIGKLPIPNIPGIGKSTDAKQKSQSFEENRTQLQQRVAVVEQGLVRSSIRVVQLGTEEVVELFYKMFNPGELEKPMPIGLQE